jgi:hypothetical protein
MIAGKGRTMQENIATATYLYKSLQMIGQTAVSQMFYVERCGD